MARLSPAEWAEVEARFVAGEDPAALAAAYGVKLGTLYARSSAGKWKSKKDAASAAVGQHVAEAVAEAVLDEIARVAKQQVADLDAFRGVLMGLLPQVTKKGAILAPGAWLRTYRDLMAAQRLALGAPETNELPPTEGGEQDGTSSVQGQALASVLVLPGKSADWAALAEAAREGPVDAQPGPADGVPGV